MKISKRQLIKIIREEKARILENADEASSDEGNAFVNAKRKAEEAGEAEFEFDGKTYPVTGKKNESRLTKRDLKKIISEERAKLRLEIHHQNDQHHFDGSLLDLDDHQIIVKRLRPFVNMLHADSLQGYSREDIIHGIRNALDEI